mmetsp:Transcript_30066/g.84859  ORF Transcript_30066/g.84859 Transcript_30066/m.84859 type:complete len:235 (-) Transcript_30066:121-825(-)
MAGIVGYSLLAARTSVRAPSSRLPSISAERPSRALAHRLTPAARHRSSAACRRNSTMVKASSETDLNLSDGCRGAPLQPGQKLPIPGTEELMSQKAHGTTDKAVQENLRWGCDRRVADNICSFNRHYAEFAGYWTKTSFLDEVDPNAVTTFYDSVSGLPLFNAPIGRTFEDFKKESMSHGWPSFRDDEVNWDYVRVLPDGEAVSTAGTHLGHNLPDRNGNRCAGGKRPSSHSLS